MGLAVIGVINLDISAIGSVTTVDIQNIVSIDRRGDGIPSGGRSRDYPSLSQGTVRIVLPDIGSIRRTAVVHVERLTRSHVDYGVVPRRGIVA